jgi:EmrB/QacA subfamily drug resistance transporter
MPDRILLPLIVACALFMENLDSTVLSTALPAIAADFGANPIHLKLALTSYLLALAVFIPASGWLADRYGARTIFRLAIAVFVLGSIACGLSSSIPEIVAARIVQGIGGSMMMPVGRLVILRSVQKHELVGSLAWLTIPALIGPVLGPPVGGFITTYFEWRWTFWINVPVGILGLVLATLYLPDIRGEQRTRFDGGGFLLSSFGLALFMTGSTTLGLHLVPTVYVLIALLVGAVLLAAYVARSRRVENPIVDLSLLRIPTVGTSLLGTLFFRIGVGATPFLLPLLLQVGFGMTPFQSGMITFAAAIGAIAMKFAAPPILRRFGFRTVLILNAVIAGAFVMLPALFTPATPVAVMTGAAPHRRLLPLPPVHQRQRARLRRHSQREDEPGDDAEQRRTAALVVDRHLGGRHRAGADGGSDRRRHRPRVLHPGVRRGRSVDRPLRGSVRLPGPRCGAGNVRSPADCPGPSDGDARPGMTV